MAGGGSHPVDGLGAPVVAGELCTDPSRQESFVSTCTGIYLHIPFQSS